MENSTEPPQLTKTQGYFIKWHSAKEVRVWLFVCATWVIAYPLVHLIFDPWGWNPKLTKFLGHYDYNGWSRAREFPAFFTVWLLPFIVAAIRHVYVRFVK